MNGRSTVLLVALLVSARADTLTLRDGVNVTGSWVGLNAGQISFLVNNQVRTYPRSEVSGVIFGFEQPSGLEPSAAREQPASSQPPAPHGLEPGTIGAVYYRDQSGALIRLERNQGVEHRGSAARRSGGASGPYWEIDRARSPVRFRSGEKILFVVRMADGIDAGTFILFPLETRKSSRVTKADPEAANAPLSLRFNVSKVGESTFEMTPMRNLPAGEYAFSPGNSNDAWCFGID